jgi:hypothetical protein
LAIVTGRSVSDVNRFLHPLRLVTAGVHGAELRTEMNGEVLLTVGPMDPAVASAVNRLRELAPGVVIESKIFSIAVHYRLAPSVEPQIEAALRGIVAGSPDHFILCPGRCVIEVVPTHLSKGAAVDALMALPAFKGRRPIMVGDDVPDESARLQSSWRLSLRVASEHFRGRADFEGRPREPGAPQWLIAGRNAPRGTGPASVAQYLPAEARRSRYGGATTGLDRLAVADRRRGVRGTAEPRRGIVLLSPASNAPCRSQRSVRVISAQPNRSSRLFGWGFTMSAAVGVLPPAGFEDEDTGVGGIWAHVLLRYQVVPSARTIIPEAIDVAGSATRCETTI